MQNNFKSIIRFEHRCALIAAICFVVASVWPATAVAGAIVASAVFCSVLSHYRFRALANLTFVFIAVSLIILVMNTDLWSAILLSTVNLRSTAADYLMDDSVRAWSIHYVAMAIDVMVVGACLVKVNCRDLLQANFTLRRPLQCPWIYLTAAFIPLFLDVVLYFTKLRGTGYLGILTINEGGGIYKHLMLLIVVTEAAFIRLLGSWANLDRRSRLLFGVAICLFLYIYIFLLTARTNLFVFAMYLYYFFGWRIRLKTKALTVLVLLALFIWIAAFRSDSNEGIKNMDVEDLSTTASFGGLFFVDMVHWAYEGVQSNGPTWGWTSLEAAFSPKDPADAYVQEKAPSYADAGGGFGFFYVAELVMDFGYVGGLFGAFFLGLALQKISILDNEWARLTVLPALLGFSFALLRNPFLMMLKTPIYVAVSCIILDRLALYAHHFGEYIVSAELSTVSQ